METLSFAPLFTLVYNQMVYVQGFPAPANKDGVQMIELRIQNTSGVYWNHNTSHVGRMQKSVLVSLKTLKKGFNARFMLPLGDQEIIRFHRFTHELTYGQQLSYDLQLEVLGGIKA